MILPAVQPGLRDVTFASNAWSQHFGKAVEIDRLDPEALLELAADGVAPGLCTEHADAQRRRAQIDPHAGGHFGDVERVGRRRAQHVGAEVLQQSYLALGPSPPIPAPRCSRALRLRNARPGSP